MSNGGCGNTNNYGNFGVSADREKFEMANQKNLTNYFQTRSSHRQKTFLSKPLGELYILLIRFWSH